jgi:hypothetical protein
MRLITNVSGLRMLLSSAEHLRTPRTKECFTKRKMKKKKRNNSTVLTRRSLLWKLL